MNRLKKFSRSKSLKNLILASMLALSMTGVYASEDHPQGTLDKLAGQDIPGTDPVLNYSESSYILTKVDESVANTITKYVYDKDLGVMVPEYYRLDLKKTNYGSENTDGKIYYNWLEDGNYVLNRGDSKLSDNSIEYSYNNSYGDSSVAGAEFEYLQWTKTKEDYYELTEGSENLYDIKVAIDPAVKTTTRITSNQNGANINKTFVGIESSGSGIYGGAIYNNGGNIGDINSLFINNSIISNNTNSFGGAILNNSGNIGDINSSFINNSITVNLANSQVTGGAIANFSGSEIHNISGDFLGNSIHAGDSAQLAYGGAIYNAGTVGDITGNFVGNYVTGSKGARGGAIYSDGKLGNITGDFVGNYVYMNSSLGQNNVGFGGAIHLNAGSVSDIVGNFIGNSVTSNCAEGGAIHTYVATNLIKGDFIGNATISSDAHSYGGAIYINDSVGVNSIIGNFIGNYAKSTNSTSVGGAIAHLYGTVDNIVGDFIANYVYSNIDAQGAAICNNDKIGDITGDFIGNNVIAKGSGTGYGGAISNLFQINDITGDFIGNYVQTSSGVAYGGGLYNRGTLNKVQGDFIGNYTSSETALSAGGAIANTGQIKSIQGNFLNNYVVSNNNEVDGGAIYNTGSIDKISGDFTGNYIKSNSGNAYGGAVYNASNASINSIDANFTNNKVLGYSYVKGSAIYNDGKISSVSGNFINNTTTKAELKEGYSGASAIFNGINAEIGDIKANFVGNGAGGKESFGAGAISNGGSIGDITGDFYKNYSSSDLQTMGGAVLNALGSVGNITGDFVGNYSESKLIAIGGAITNSIGTIGNIKGNFINNRVSASSYTLGGAIANFMGYIGFYDKESKVLQYAEIINSSFYDNYAESKNNVALGGAIFSTTPLNITADNGKSIFSGNKTISKGKTEYNALGVYGYYNTDENGNSGYIDPKNDGNLVKENTASLTLKAVNNGVIQFDDKISGGAIKNGATENDLIILETPEYSYDMKITGDDTGKVILNNDVKNAKISLDTVSLYLGARDNVLDNNNLTLNSGTINMVNNKAGVSSLNTLTINGDTNMVADVDLAKGAMDRFSANLYRVNKGNLHVLGMNMLSDAPEGQDVTEIYFAQVGLKDNVINGVNETPTSHQTTAYTPIYKYNVMYDNRENAGYFLFTKGDRIFTPGGGIENTGNPSDAFNPSILASPVATQAGAYSTQLQTFNYAFQHADTFMPLPSNERFSLRNSDKYAITSYDNLSLANNDFHEKAIWVRPYTSFENIPLKNGPKVDTITYGTLVGGDSSFKELRNGWGRVFTGYVGYNGSSQSYSGVNTYQNGGLIGATQTFYKGNFFTALTASAGASAGESHNMYGHENFSTLMAGIASKSGYNIEFKDGKYIIQPTMLLSYSFINTFDYRNSAGVKINSDPLHAIQLNPNVRFIANLKNGWQPYASVGMVWNILDDTKVMANDVRLPEMSIKPYVEYGLGVQKRWKDKYTGYVQAMIRNGGRNGVSLTGGFRWALGKEGKPIEKVQTKTNKTAQVTNTTNGRKIIKQLSQAQRTALGAKPQNTTRTTNVGVLKQL